MSPINGFIIFSLFVTAVYLGSLVSFLTDYEDGKCEMTYMFEYPQFVRIPNPIDETFKKYGLYSYSEGRLTEKARNMHFDGIPVLFIPGSAGSFKQARSLASIALRKSLNSRLSYHFDYFTVDLNEELSGFNGAVLNDQTEYVNNSISTILKLYNPKRGVLPGKVVLIGHSMGAVVAKKIISSLPLNTDLIPIVIALSAPLIRPVVITDFYMKKFYDELDKTFVLSNSTTFISLAGGYNDFLVPPYVTKNGHITAVATVIPKCWISPDHLSIVWCKQFVMAVNRALFASVDLKTKQISTNHDVRMAAFNHYLIQHPVTSLQNRDRYNHSISFNNQGDWFESVNRQYSVRLPKGTRSPKWYMIPLIIQPRHDALTIVALNMEAVDWVYMCPAIVFKGSQRICDMGKHLSHLSEISPSLKYKRRTLRLNLYDAKSMYPTASHVIVKVSPTDDPVVLHIDFYGSKDRKITVQNLPKWYTYTKHTVIEKTEEKAVHYDLLLPDLSQITQSYLLYMEAENCSGDSHHATASLIVPWDNHDLHGFVSQTEKKPINMRLYAPKPLDKPNESAKIRLTLDPTCRYKISIKNTVHFGNMARFYSPLLFANIAAVLLMTLRAQLKNIANKEQCSLFFTALKEGARPYYVVPVARILSKFSNSKIILMILPPSDWQLLGNENLDFMILSILLYIISVGIVWILAMALSISFIFFESTLHKFLIRFMTKTFSGRQAWTDHLSKAFEKIPGVVAAFLIMTSISTSGGLAICLATVFYFLKLTQMAQDFIEDLVKSVAKSVAKKLKDKFLSKILDKIFKTKKKQETKPLPIENLENKPIPNIETVNESGDAHKPSCSKNDLNLKTDIKDIAEDDDYDSSDEINLEKPMEIEVPSLDEPNKTEIVSGEKLIKLLYSKGKKNEVENLENAPKKENDDQSNEGINETSENKCEAETVFNKINLEWIKEIMENNEIFFHFTMFMIYFLVACLNIPSVLTWAHNFRYQKNVDPDPVKIPGIILSICTLPLWQFQFPRVDRKFYLEISYVIYAAAVVSLIYGVISIYRLSFILSFSVALVTLHQIFAIKKPEPQDQAGNNENDEDVTESYQRKVKDKWE